MLYPNKDLVFGKAEEGRVWCSILQDSVLCSLIVSAGHPPVAGQIIFQTWLLRHRMGIFGELGTRLVRNVGGGLSFCPPFFSFLSFFFFNYLALETMAKMSGQRRGDVSVSGRDAQA